MLGRDALCELPLRSAGISRQHAAIAVAADPPGFSLRDAGSRNGTLIGGMPVSGAVPLAGEGAFALGDHCTVGYRVDGDPPRLRLHIEDGMDRGLVLITSASPAAALDLSDEGLPVKVAFRDGRPHLGPASEQISITLDGELVAHGSVQLVRGDAVIVRGPAGSEEIDVE
jgi:hypothetical protein